MYPFLPCSSAYAWHMPAPQMDDTLMMGVNRPAQKPRKGAGETSAE